MAPRDLLVVGFPRLAASLSVSLDMTPDAWRWTAVIVGLLVGAGLVWLGLVDGNGWLSFAGTVLTGGSGLAAPGKKVP